MQTLLSAYVDGNYDIQLDDTGNLKMVDDLEGADSMMRLDVNSNQNWLLDYRLGINWLNEYNTGVLQQTGNRELVVNTLIEKLNSIDYIENISSLALTPVNDRELLMEVEVKIKSGELTTITQTIII